VAAIVVGIMGSPRMGGNTDRMVRWVLDAAQKTGAQVECIILREQRIGHCCGCDVCHSSPHRCINQDDMETLQPILESAQAFVLGTPVYWWGPSGHMKSFVDRWYGFQGDRSGTIRGKKFGLVLPMADDDPSTGRHVVGMFSDALDYLGCTLHKAVLAPGCGAPGDVEGKPEVKAKCDELGRWLGQAPANPERR
jgi:multimeric flavodoxin WrbA